MCSFFFFLLISDHHESVQFFSHNQKRKILPEDKDLYVLLSPLSLMMATDIASSAPRPKRLQTASGKLLDASNSATPTLSAHKHAIEAKRASDAATSSLSVPASDTPIPTSTPSSPPVTDAALDISSDSDQESQQPRKCFYLTN
jgi:hypothetical protein